MKLYIDTANMAEIKWAAETHLIDGVTTNPTWITKESDGKTFRQIIKDIERAVHPGKKEFTISAEVHGTDWKEMVKEGTQYAKWGKHVIIKLPMTRDGLMACQELAKKRIKVNVTLCFSANQALLAAKAGAWCVSPFVGRLDRAGHDGLKLIEEIRQIYDNYGFKTRILVASVHDPNTVKQSAVIGADMITMMPEVFKNMFKHPFTDAGLKQFLDDYQKYKMELEHPLKKV